MLKFFSLLLLGLMLFTVIPFSTLANEESSVLLTCHAEPRWTYASNVRRGPGTNWGILKQISRRLDLYEMRVVGQDTSGEWFQVVMPEPYADVVGWVWLGNINLYGACADLPLTDANPEITIEQVPPIPDPVPLPAYASTIHLRPEDRAFLLKPGILYVRREIAGLSAGDEGLQAHILVMDLQAPQLQVDVRIGAIPDRDRVPTSQIALDAGAFAAINGDYYGGNYMPQNLTIIDGQVVSAPKHRAAFALTPDKQPYIGYFTEGWTWGASVVAANGQSIPLQLMNLPCDPLWLCLYSHHMNGEIPAKYAGVRVLLDKDFKVLDIVQDRRVEIPEDHFVLNGGDVTGEWLLNNITIGDQIQVLTPTIPDWRGFETAIGGGPRVLLNGEFWQDCDPNEVQPACEEFDENFRNNHYYDQSIPRTAVGYNDEHTLLVAIMVEGYEVSDSRGATQRELALMFQEMGATQAMEFDGGGSSTMWIAPGGSVNDFGTEGERKISNALLFFWED